MSSRMRPISELDRLLAQAATLLPHVVSPSPTPRGRPRWKCNGQYFRPHVAIADATALLDALNLQRWRSTIASMSTGWLVTLVHPNASLPDPHAPRWRVQCAEPTLPMAITLAAVAAVAAMSKEPS